MRASPLLLSPSARRLAAAAVRSGGFPPLYIDPIYFATLYRQRVEEMQAQQGAAGTPVS